MYVMLWMNISNSDTFFVKNNSMIHIGKFYNLCKKLVFC